MQETTASDEPVQVHHDLARPAYGYTPDPITARAWNRAFERLQDARSARETRARILADRLVEGDFDRFPDALQWSRDDYATAVAAEDYARAVWNVEHELSQKARADQC